MCPGRSRRRCTRRTTSRSRTRRWTISPMPAFCTSTASSIRKGPLGSRMAAQGRRGRPRVARRQRSEVAPRSSTRMSRWARTRSYRTSRSSTSATRARYLLAQGDLGRSASWGVIPVADVVSATTSPVPESHVRRTRLEPRRCIWRNALRLGFNAASTVGVGPVIVWSVSLSGGVRARRRPLPAARRHGLPGQPIRRLRALHRHGHARHHRATPRLRLLPRPDVLHQDVRNRAAASRVRNLESVLVL